METSHIRPPDHPVLTPVHLYRDLVSGPADSRDLQQRVGSGVLARVRRGAYVDGRAWASLDAAGRHAVRGRAVWHQAKTDVVLSHATSLALCGAPVWGMSLDDVHLTRPDGNSGRNGARVRQHAGHLAEGDVMRLGDVLVTSPTRTALDVTMMGNTEAALCAVNHLLHHRMTTKSSMRDRYLRAEDGFPRGMVHWPHSLATEHVLRLADPRVESVGESRAFHLMWQSGIPLPVPQWEVLDEEGRLVARLDFAWPDLGAFLEFHGKVKLTHHLRPGETAADAVMRERRRLERVVALTGWRPIQWDWSDLERPAPSAARLRNHLGLTGGKAA